jgi:hypothetical protein
VTSVVGTRVLSSMPASPIGVSFHFSSKMFFQGYNNRGVSMHRTMII